MKLTVRRGGGIAGIVARTELDTAALPPPDAQALASRIDDAGLRDLKEPPAAGRRPDAQLYEISWEESGHRYSLHYTEETLPESLRRLLAWIDGRTERTESLEL